MIKNIGKLVSMYPNLVYYRSEQSNVAYINGTFQIQRVHDGFVVNQEYSISIKLIDIDIPCVSVQETGGAIDRHYPHFMSDHSLCLGVNSEILLRCYDGEGFDIFLWFDIYVIPYFFSYEFYKVRGYYPFGERSHGIDGILEFYTEFFNVKSIVTAFECMKFVLTQPCKGHLLCPCGSGERLRVCHFRELIKANEPLCKRKICDDYCNIIRK